MTNLRNLGSKENLAIKFKDGICADLCLNLRFESDIVIFVILRVIMVLKATVQKEISKPSLPQVKLTWGRDGLELWKSNCPEVHCGTLDSYFRSNDLVSASADFLFLYNVGWLQLRRFVDLLRVRSLHSISRNHPNTLCWPTCRKQKFVQSNILQQKDIKIVTVLTGFLSTT